MMSLIVGSDAAIAQGNENPIDALLTRYAAGEPVLADRVPTEASLDVLRPDLLAAARLWRQPWNPLGAAFLLDLALWSLAREWRDGLWLLRTAEGIVTGRQTPAATPPDSFELLFHRAALVGLISTNHLAEAEDYFGRLDARLAAIGAGERLTDPRLLLLRGLLDEAWTAPAVRAFSSGSATLPSAIVAPDEGAIRGRLELALASFERASHAPEVAAEAAVRRAFVLHRLGRHQEALVALDAVDTARAPRAIEYWRRLFRGRVLEALRRIDDAAAAYLSALRIEATAQTPAVALASLFQRQGNAEQARRWAASARATEPTGLDPWWQYWFGDLRWLGIWMADLRRAASS